MIAIAIVLIEATDPKVYYYNIINIICVYCLMSNFVSDIHVVLYINLRSKIKFLLLLLSAQMHLQCDIDGTA